eukprot:1070305-Prymnesium_polylepis.1
MTSGSTRLTSLRSLDDAPPARLRERCPTSHPSRPLTVSLRRCPRALARSPRRGAKIPDR